MILTGKCCLIAGIRLQAKAATPSSRRGQIWRPRSHRSGVRAPGTRWRAGLARMRLLPITLAPKLITIQGNSNRRARERRQRARRKEPFGTQAREERERR